MFYSPSQNGFYLPEIHGDSIPADAVEISAERHAELIAGQTAGRRIAAGRDGAPILIDPPAPPAPSAHDVRAECARRLTAVVAGYTPEERETWPVQIAEARAVVAGAAEAPMLTVLAAARGLPLSAFAAAVLQVTAATTAATAKLLAAQARMLAMPAIPADYTADHWWA